jgi:hypothetical protein
VWGRGMAVRLDYAWRIISTAGLHFNSRLHFKGRAAVTDAIGGSVGSLEHDLVGNALAFLSRSVAAIRGDDSEHSVAFAIADLAGAVEVLMKARLVREHWTLVCESPDKATLTALANGIAITVNPDKAADRLQNVAGMDMQTHRNALKDIARLRNRALHFTLTTGGELPVGVRAQYGRALNFVLWFLNSEFRKGTSGNIRGLVEEVIENLTTEVGEIDDLVTARMETIAAELDGADDVWSVHTAVSRH